MSENKIKINVARKNPPIVMSEIKELYPTEGYYHSSKSLINKINTHFGLKRDQLDWKFYDNNYEEIVKFILNTYTIRQHSALTAKFACLTKPMRLCNVECSFMYMGKALMQIPLKMCPKNKQIAPWDETVEELKKARLNAVSNNAYNVCTIYIHGYPIRLKDILFTSIIESDEHNFLDCDNLMWYIRKDLTKQRKARQFAVTQELVDDLKGHIHNSGLLVCRKAGGLFTSNIVMKTLGLDFVIAEMRNSYETMNLAREDITNAEKYAISNNVLGHSTSIAFHSYTKNDLALSLLEDSDEECVIEPKEGLIEPKDFVKMPMV